jgi:hypothetical protein
LDLSVTLFLNKKVDNTFLLWQAYRQELLEAYDCCMNYKRTGKDAELTQV